MPLVQNSFYPQTSLFSHQYQLGQYQKDYTLPDSSFSHHYDQNKLNTAQMSVARCLSNDSLKMDNRHLQDNSCTTTTDSSTNSSMNHNQNLAAYSTGVNYSHYVNNFFEPNQTLNTQLNNYNTNTGIYEVSRIKTAYESKIGKKVPKSTVYRMLDRHNWREVVPRTKHPKSDKEAQENFKKTFLKS